MNAASSSSTFNKSGDDFFTFTVGKLDAGMAILIGERASLIEFPSLLLPTDVVPGSVVNIAVSRNTAEERKKLTEFDELQEEILDIYGRHTPQAPTLRLRNTTQTSVTLEWDRLQLHTAQLLSLDIYRNSSRLASIPNARHNTSTKLSGLDVAASYTFHLILRTTAGTLHSNVLRVRTHDMTDTSGISVCFGDMSARGGGGGGGPGQGGAHAEASGQQLEQAAKRALEGMGARWSDRILIETTHFVCTSSADRGGGGTTQPQQQPPPKGAMFAKAQQLSIPIVQPHWIFACKEQKRMVPISSFYLDQEPPNTASVQSVLRQSHQHHNGNGAAGGGSGSGSGGGGGGGAVGVGGAAQGRGETATAAAAPPSPTPPPPPAANEKPAAADPPGVSPPSVDPAGAGAVAAGTGAGLAAATVPSSGAAHDEDAARGSSRSPAGAGGETDGGRRDDLATANPAAETDGYAEAAGETAAATTTTTTTAATPPSLAREESMDEVSLGGA